MKLIHYMLLPVATSKVITKTITFFSYDISRAAIKTLSFCGNLKGDSCNVITIFKVAMENNISMQTLGVTTNKFQRLDYS